MRSTILLAATLLLGLAGCVTKFADQSCQDRGFSPGTGLYGACYSSAVPAIAEAYGRAALAPLQWPYAAAPAQ